MAAAEPPPAASRTIGVLAGAALSLSRPRFRPPGIGCVRFSGSLRPRRKSPSSLAAGYDSAMIAKRRSLGVNTVRVHIARIMAKTETKRQAELLRLPERPSGMSIE
jgi:DNA-binding NarL/FixJ family response regulator